MDGAPGTRFENSEAEPFCSSMAGMIEIAGGILLVVVALFLAIKVFKARKYRAANNGARSALLDVAVQKYRCESIPEGYKSCCYVCHARSTLRDHFPGKLPYAIRAYVLAGGTLTEDLASCMTEADRFILNDELNMGWKVPFHPKSRRRLGYPAYLFPRCQREIAVCLVGRYADDLREVRPFRAVGFAEAEALAGLVEPRAFPPMPR